MFLPTTVWCMTRLLLPSRRDSKKRSTWGEIHSSSKSRFCRGNKCLSTYNFTAFVAMDLLPDTLNCALCIHRECLERIPSHRFQRKPIISNPGMHHGTCVAHVPWCMSGSLIRGSGEHVSDIPGATRDLTYLPRGLFADGNAVKRNFVSLRHISPSLFSMCWLGCKH